MFRSEKEITYRLRPIVPTLDSQRRLICKREVAMPAEEIARAVDGHGVLHVNSDEVIIACLCARVLRGGELGGRFGDAEDGGYVSFLLGGGDITPVGFVSIACNA